MTTQLDAQIGFKKESSFGTPVTVDTFVEFTAEDLDHTVTRVQGAGMRVGQRVDYADRWVTVKEEASGSFTVEVQSKGHGKLIEAALGGTGTSTQASGAVYQQLFTPTTTDYLSSYTIQKGVPPLGGGSTNAMTFDGMVCSGFELAGVNGGIPTLKFNWMGRALSTATSLEVASYPSSVEQLSFVHGNVVVGGTITVPTTTALGSSSASASANVRDFTLTYDNGLDSNGFNFGGAGKRSRKPALGKRVIGGSLTVEYDSNTLRDAWLAGTSLGLILEFKSTVAITGSYYPTFQITIPVMKLNGELPKVNGGDVVTQTIPFEVKDGRSASHPFYVAIVTAETAI